MIERRCFTQSTQPSPFDGAPHIPSTLLPSSVSDPSFPSPKELSHETSASPGPALNWCAPAEEEADDQTLWMESPAPRRPIVRLEVRHDMRRVNGRRLEPSLVYACESLPYNAGFRPHAYVDNYKYATRSKRDLEGDFYAMDEPMEEEDHDLDKPKGPKIFRRLARKRLSKLIRFGLPRSSALSPVESHISSSRPPTISSSAASSTGRYPGNH